MSLSALVDTNLVRAFNLLKDLAIDVAFVHKSGTSFSFTTGGVSHASSTSTTVKAVKISEEKRVGSSNVLAQELMFKSKDIPNVSDYDSVIIDGTTWLVGAPSKGDGRITILTISRTE